MINVRLDPRLWARVKVVAGQRGITLERWVAEALDAHLAQHQERGSQPAIAGAEGPLTELARRVAALEWAVDHLAQAIAADMPAASAAGGEGPGGGAVEDGATMEAESDAIVACAHSVE